MRTFLESKNSFINNAQKTFHIRTLTVVTTSTGSCHGINFVGTLSSSEKLNFF